MHPGSSDLEFLQCDLTSLIGAWSSTVSASSAGNYPHLVAPCGTGFASNSRYRHFFELVGATVSVLYGPVWLDDDWTYYLLLGFDQLSRA